MSLPFFVAFMIDGINDKEFGFTRVYSTALRLCRGLPMLLEPQVQAPSVQPHHHPFARERSGSTARRVIQMRQSHLSLPESDTCQVSHLQPYGFPGQRDFATRESLAHFID